jgi:hypothetical protein
MSSERVGQSHGNSATATAHASGKSIDETNRNAEEFDKMLDRPENGQSDMQYYLELQRAMMKEQQAYTALSNVLKARSDACLSAVRNFKQ